MELIYEGAQLLVCYKPQGVLSAADASGKPSMTSLLAPRTVYPVHRLDREACGLMVFAKTQACAAALSAAMQQGAFQKEYLALCEGTPPVSGVWEDLLYHDRTKNKTYVVKRRRAGVREAKLAYRVLYSAAGQTLAAVRLFTGRTHQIRVQFASRGFPLKGDRKYGAASAGPLMLCSWGLSFPESGENRAFSLPEELLPPEIAAIVRNPACKTERSVL